MKTHRKEADAHQGSSAKAITLGARKYRRILDAFFVTLAVNVLVGGFISAAELWNLDLLANLFDSGSSEFHSMIMLVYRYEALGAVVIYRFKKEHGLK